MNPKSWTRGIEQGRGVFIMSKLTDDDKLDIIIQYEVGVKTSKIAMHSAMETCGVFD